MPFVAFHELCPDVAERETRTITVLPDSNAPLPPGDYSFFDMYCNEKACDCRRVFFTVVSSVSKKTEALITWGWEDKAFYKKWLGSNDPDMAEEMKGPVLDIGSPRSQTALALLGLASRVLLADPHYVERIKRHYALFRAQVDDGASKVKKGSTKPARKRGGRWGSSR